MDSKSKFGFGGGKGMLEVRNLGYQDYFYEKYNETISVGRNNIRANNVAFGTFYLDVFGDIDAINHRTKERALVKFHPCGWSTMSYIEGQIFDSSGKEMYTLKGSWIDKIILVNS